MKEPRSELTATDSERADAPDFDALTAPAEVVRGDRTRDDFFDAVLRLDGPATASEVADRASHGVDAAREYLEWFERMGIVTRATESPATYERNQEYLNGRRVQRLQERYAADDLLEYLQTKTDRDEDYAETVDIDSLKHVQQAIANAYYEDRLEFEQVKAVVDVETAQNFRVLKHQLTDDRLSDDLAATLDE